MDYAANLKRIIRGTERTKLEDALRFALKIERLPPPVLQFQFCETRKWRTDFAWPEEKILLEVEGGIWRKNHLGQWAGAHSFPANILRDIEKQNAAALMGYSYLRVTKDMIKDGTAVELIKKMLAVKSCSLV